MSVDLRTTYLGLELEEPAGGLKFPNDRPARVLRQMEEAGAAAVVMPSLFEEQLERDELAVRGYFERGIDQFVNTLSELSELDLYNTGPAEYLRGIKQAKQCFPFR